MTLRGTISPDKPLLVVALEEEAQHFPDDLPILLLGVGKVNAGIRMAEVLAHTKPSEIINIGTAGGLATGIDGTDQLRFGPPVRGQSRSAQEQDRRADRA